MSCSGLRVSSHALKMGSTVFKAMLGRHFKEGRALTFGEIEIPLPDDETECMLAICKVMHMQHSASQLDTDWLRLYELSDKYDVVTSMAPVAQVWMRTH